MKDNDNDVFKNIVEHPPARDFTDLIDGAAHAIAAAEIVAASDDGLEALKFLLKRAREDLSIAQSVIRKAEEREARHRSADAA